MPQLAQSVAENLVAHVPLNALDANQVRSFVERYITEQDPGKKWQHTAGQVMEVINRSRLRDHRANPLMLFNLLEIIDGISVDRGKQLHTRGRLLRAYVKHLNQRERTRARWGSTAPTDDDVLLFLSELACAARWTSDSNAIQLPVSGKGGTVRIEDLAGGLLTWLNEHASQSLWSLVAFGTMNQAPMLHGRYSPEELSRLVEFPQGAALIEISPGGILSFRHE